MPGKIRDKGAFLSYMPLLVFSDSAITRQPGESDNKKNMMLSIVRSDTP